MSAEPNKATLISQSTPVNDTYNNDEPEITLLDLWLTLIKWRKLFWAVWIISMLVGSVMVLSLPRQFLYSTAIEIGTVVRNTELQLVEDVGTVQAKLASSYIPLVQQKYAMEHPDDARQVAISVQVPKRSKLTILESRGKLEDEQLHLILQQQVLDKLIEDHQRTMEVERTALEGQLVRARLALQEVEDPRSLDAEKKGLETALAVERSRLKALADPKILAVSRKRLEAGLTEARDALAGLRDEAKVLQARYERLDETKALLAADVETLSSQIEDALARRKAATTGVSDESRAMTLLLIDNELMQNRNRLSALQERLHIQLEDRRQELAKELESNRREQQTQRERVSLKESELAKLDAELALDMAKQAPRPLEVQARIDKLVADYERKIAEQRQVVTELESRLKNFRETRAIVAPMRSLKPTGTPRIMLLLAMAVISSIAAVVAILLAEFLNRARQAMA